MTRRFSSISVQTTLGSSISNNALTLTVAAGTGSALLGGATLAPSDVDQFSITLNPDSVNEEIVWVTGISTDTLTIVRGRDGTSGVAHTAGAVIKHVLTGGDLIYLMSAVAPLADLSTGLPFPGSTSGTNTVKAPAVAGTVVSTLPSTTSTLIGKTTTDVVTNKSIDLTTNTVTGTIAQFNTAVSDADLATLAGTEELTNKTFADAKIHSAINGQSGTTYTFVLTDDNKVVTFTNSSPITATVPANADVAFPIGTSITGINVSTGLTTFAAGAGVTINGYGTLKLRAQNAWGTLLKTGTNTWYLTGDIV